MSAKLEAAFKLAAETHGHQYLEYCSDHNVNGDNHDHDQEYCTHWGAELAKAALAYDPDAKTFEVEVENPHYRYTSTTYYVFGKDEDDAVRRFNEAVALATK